MYLHPSIVLTELQRNKDSALDPPVSILGTQQLGIPKLQAHNTSRKTSTRTLHPRTRPSQMSRCKTLLFRGRSDSFRGQKCVQANSNVLQQIGKTATKINPGAKERRSSLNTHLSRGGPFYGPQLSRPTGVVPGTFDSVGTLNAVALLPRNNYLVKNQDEETKKGSNRQV